MNKADAVGILALFGVTGGPLLAIWAHFMYEDHKKKWPWVAALTYVVLTLGPVYVIALLKVFL